jgi:hypothetical protein
MLQPSAAWFKGSERTRQQMFTIKENFAAYWRHLAPEGLFLHNGSNKESENDGATQKDRQENKIEIFEQNA